MLPNTEFHWPLERHFQASTLRQRKLPVAACQLHHPSALINLKHESQGSQSLYKTSILMNTARACNTWAAANPRAILAETPLFSQNGMEFPTYRSLILVFSVWQTVDNL